MKAVTVKQPYASLIRNGIKKYEFRNLNTSYRGPIFIHASKQDDPVSMIIHEHLNLDYKRSKIIAIANLVDCLEFNDELREKLIAEEQINYSFSKCSHKYAWVLEDVKPIDSNVEVRGQLGIWNIKDYELIEELKGWE